MTSKLSLNHCAILLVDRKVYFNNISKSVQALLLLCCLAGRSNQCRIARTMQSRLQVNGFEQEQQQPSTYLEFLLRVQLKDDHINAGMVF